jgi:hypothetical protein
MRISLLNWKSLKGLTAAHLESADVGVEGVLREVHLAGDGHCHSVK